MNLYKIVVILVLCPVQILYAGKSVFSHLDVDQTKSMLQRTKDIEGSMIIVANKRKNYSDEDALKTYNRAKSLVASIESINTIAADALKEKALNRETKRRAEGLMSCVNEELKSARELQTKSKEHCEAKLIDPNSPPLNTGEDDDEDISISDESDDE